MAVYLTNSTLLPLIRESKNSFGEVVPNGLGDFDQHWLEPDFYINDTTPLPDDDKFEGKVIRVVGHGHLNPLDVAYLSPYRNAPIRELRRARDTGCFRPFRNYMRHDGEWHLVFQSHLKNGRFSYDHGKINNDLAKAFILMVDKIIRKPNWSQYTANWQVEMKSHAIMGLVANCLQFNECKNDWEENTKPFSYYTTVIENCFKQTVKKEKQLRKFIESESREEGVDMGYGDN